MSPEMMSKNFSELGVWFMDETHKEAEELLHKVNAAPNEDLLPLVEELVIHTKEHFAQELQLMNETDFPAKNEHESEHYKILSDLLSFQASVKRGRFGMARQFFRSMLPEMLENHILQSDSALAGHVKTKWDSIHTGQLMKAPAFHKHP